MKRAVCPAPGTLKNDTTALKQAPRTSGGRSVIITGRHGFERLAAFAVDEDRVRETIDDEF